jgi:hypothetical protein
MTIQARADLAALLPAFDSKAEAWWERCGSLLIMGELDQRVALTQYHPVTFRLPGGSYTPDFLHILADGRLVFVEIKGSTHQKNYRDARSKLRATAELYAWATFYEAIVSISSQGCEKLERISP